MNIENSQRYGNDFAVLLGKVYVILRAHVGEYHRVN